MQSDSLRGSALSTDDLLKAYRLGYFPMSEGRDDPEVFWVLPQFRGVLPLDDFHVSRSLRKAVRQDRVEIRIDTAFRETMIGCAAPAPGREDTWINERILATYCDLHHQGFAHSVEAWQDGALVGGLYGVCFNGAFFGESMFSRVTDASKIALVHLVARMRAGGFSLLDTQFHTDHLEKFGLVVVPKKDYQAMLDDAMARVGDFFALPRHIDGAGILASLDATT